MTIAALQASAGRVSKMSSPTCQALSDGKGPFFVYSIANVDMRKFPLFLLDLWYAVNEVSE